MNIEFFHKNNWKIKKCLNIFEKIVSKYKLIKKIKMNNDVHKKCRTMGSMLCIYYA